MSLRFNALNKIVNERNSVDVAGPAKITAIFGENVFTLKTAREYLSDEAYKSLRSSTKSGHKIDRAMAAQISNGIKAWALKQSTTGE